VVVVMYVVVANDKQDVQHVNIRDDNTCCKQLDAEKHNVVVFHFNHLEWSTLTWNMNSQIISFPSFYVHKFR
jgi:hypothetical protein